LDPVLRLKPAKPTADGFEESTQHVKETSPQYGYYISTETSQGLP
jgi:hypothetical protein